MVPVKAVMHTAGGFFFFYKIHVGVDREHVRVGYSRAEKWEEK